MIEQGHDLEERQQPRHGPRRRLGFYVWSIGLALVLMPFASRIMRAFFGQRQDRNFASGLSGKADLIRRVHVLEEQEEKQKEQKTQKRAWRREFWSYVWGVVLALMLTLVPFAMVHRAVVPRFSLFIVIGALALVQMIVHFRFFLRIGFRQKREDLQLILFSTLLLIIMVAGTIWIMASLATRMSMPLHA